MSLQFNSMSARDLADVYNDLGTNLVGLEVGVWYGTNFGYLLDSCPNIKTLHGVDPYLPYEDWNRFIDNQTIKAAEESAVKIADIFPGRARLWRETSESLASRAVQEGIDKLDFIFIDGDHSFERCYEDLNLWYDNVRPGGIFSGHDFSLPGVNKALYKFRTERKIKGFFKVVAVDAWYWIKD